MSVGQTVSSTTNAKHHVAITQNIHWLPFGQVAKVWIKKNTDEANCENLWEKKAKKASAGLFLKAIKNNIIHFDPYQK